MRTSACAHVPRTVKDLARTIASETRTGSGTETSNMTATATGIEVRGMVVTARHTVTDATAGAGRGVPGGVARTEIGTEGQVVSYYMLD